MTQMQPPPLHRALAGPLDQPTLIFERTYSFPVTDLWDALTDPRRLERWFGTFAGPPPQSVDDSFEIDLGGSPEDRARGTITHCTPGRHIAYNWQWQNERPSRVEIELFARGEECVLRLEHTLTERRNVVGYGGGWEQVLLALDDEVTGTPSPEAVHRATEEEGIRAWRALQEGATGR